MMKKSKTYEELGRDLAEKCFEHYFRTGRCMQGSAEYMVYCETLAGAMRSNKRITKRQVSLIRELMQDKNDSFYNGVCSFLLEKIGDYQQNSRDN